MMGGAVTHSVMLFMSLLTLSLSVLCRGVEVSQAEGQCTTPGQPGSTSAPSLVQRHTSIEHGVVTSDTKSNAANDCASKLNHWETYPSACVVIRDNKALLVKVPYGSNPGWDLPGGYHKQGEPACATAEREVCEESRYAVRAIDQLSSNVFRCEVTGSNACRHPVDEGFLESRWFAADELDSLQLRGWTWGDKLGLLKQELGVAHPPSLIHKQSVQAVVASSNIKSDAANDCASKLNHWETHPSACVVIRDNKALLVKVPYGSNPGWDLPGGYHKQGEPACATAEREVCEESRYAVKAVDQLSSNVFRCEVTGSNVCRHPVDEGFLESRWFAADELDSLKLRGWTWGDKLGLLKQELGVAHPPSLIHKRSLHAVVATSDAKSNAANDCASNLNHWETYPSACVVIRDNKALLVKVPYGSNPGWDLPGGYHKQGEPACATAEREVCEESRYAVRAIGQLSSNVFRCEVTGSNVCRHPVDEGFLEARWFTREELNGLTFRSWTWGDKLGLLKQELP